ncbi:MAG: Vacuolar ATP synthase subunit C, partial [Paramarteilia canceri]
SKSELFYKNVDNEKYDVVPKTLVKVAEDQNSIAFVVVVMKKNSKPFIEFLNSLHFSACEILNGYESEKSFWADRAELQERLDAAITVSRSWLDMTSVDFINLWIHLKIICLHVSSVLKFGKVKNSSTVDLLVLSIPLKSQEKAVKEALEMIGHQILSAAQSKQVLIGPTNKKKIEEFQLPYSIQEFLMCC